VSGLIEIDAAALDEAAGLANDLSFDGGPRFRMVVPFAR
jgi:hypothetical protein